MSPMMIVGASTNPGGTRCPQRVGHTAALAVGYLRLRWPARHRLQEKPIHLFVNFVSFCSILLMARQSRSRSARLAFPYSRLLPFRLHLHELVFDLLHRVQTKLVRFFRSRPPACAQG